MKKLLVITVIFLYCFSFISCKDKEEVVPKNISLSLEGKTWSILHYVPYAIYPPAEGSYTMHRTYVKGDTVIENIHYKKIIGIKNTENPNTMGVLRETDAKVYARAIYTDNTISPEGLLYDFNAKKGDTIFVCNYFLGKDEDKYAQKLIVKNTREDTKTGYKYIEFEGYEMSWIVGVGSLRGLLNVCSSSLGPGITRVLLCCKENNNLIYLNKEFKTCYYSSKK